MCLSIFLKVHPGDARRRYKKAIKAASYQGHRERAPVDWIPLPGQTSWDHVDNPGCRILLLPGPVCAVEAVPEACPGPAMERGGRCHRVCQVN